MTTPDLARLQRVDLRHAWQDEALHFTPWLAQTDNLALLGETVGLQLELEATEKSVGPFAADILCREPVTGQWVLIENQLERTDHTHLGQIITYAAGLDAVTVIWVAAEIREEHRAALDWLNEITAEGHDFFGVEVELWRIGDGPQVAPKFNMVSKPNAWSRQVSKSSVERPRWNEESFFVELQERHADAVAPARAILEWGHRQMPNIWWGYGAQDGSFFLGLNVDGVRHLVASAWTYGRLEFQFGRMKDRPVFDSEAKRLELLHKLNSEVGLKLPKSRIDKRPAVPLATFADPAKLKALLAVLDWYVAEIKAGHGE